MSLLDANSGYLEGHLLIAMPAMMDPRFTRTLIYMCAHNAEGAMGLVVNRILGSLTFPELLEQLGIDSKGSRDEIRVHFGGPVEAGRGFVLHSSDYVRDGTLIVDDNIALTATVDILQEIAGGQGPRHNLLALGYAGWGPGQLENEIQENAWLSVMADDLLLFDTDVDTKWERAMHKLGVDHHMLMSAGGHA